MNKKEKLKHELLLNDAYAWQKVLDIFYSTKEMKDEEIVEKVRNIITAHHYAREHILGQSPLQQLDKEFGISELRKEILGK